MNAIIPVQAAEHMTAVLWENMTVTANPGTKDAETDYLGEVATCTAVVLSATDRKSTVLKMATARHCAQDEIESDGLGDSILVHGEMTRVQFFNGDEGKVIAVHRLPHDDLAVLTVHTKRSHPVETVRGNPPHRGDHLAVFGGPEDILWSLQSAISTTGSDPQKVEDYAPWDHSYAMECAICAPGDSGAGVWNSDGHLVGFVVAGVGSSTYYEPVGLLP